MVQLCVTLFMHAGLTGQLAPANIYHVVRRLKLASKLTKSCYRNACRHKR